MQDISISSVVVVVQVLLYAGISYIILKRLKFPYTIGLVLIGLLLGGLANRYGLFPALSQLHLTENLILYVLLPALVFDAAFNMDVRLLWKNLRPVLVLAVPGLVLATLVTGWLVHAWTPLSIGAAMVFGALISATDPVAVIALFHELGAPKRLTMLVDGESLFNDATAIVMFSIVLELVASGKALSTGVVLFAAIEFLWVFLGGLVVGALVGGLVMACMRWVRSDPLVQLTFTIVSAYVSFLIAQGLMGLSGVMATVGAGLVTAHYGRVAFSRESKEYLHHFWSFSSFAANSFVFLVIGLTEVYLSRGQGLGSTFVYAFAAILAITIARALMVWGSFAWLNRKKGFEKVDWRNQLVVILGGLRGALPIALAVSILPDDVGGAVNRQLIVDFTLAVVIFSLLAQGMTIGRVLDRLSLMRETLPQKMIRLRGAIGAWRKTLGFLAKNPFPDESRNALFDEAHNRYRESLHSMKEEMAALNAANPGMARQVADGLAWKYTLSVMRGSIENLHAFGVLDDESAMAAYLQVEDLRDCADRGERVELVYNSPAPTRLRHMSRALLGGLAKSSPFVRWCLADDETKAWRHALGCVVMAMQAQGNLDALSEKIALGKEPLERVARSLESFREQALVETKKLREAWGERAEAHARASLDAFTASLTRRSIGDLRDEGIVDEIVAAFLESMSPPRMAAGSQAKG